MGRPSRILVLDDEPHLLQATSRLLEQAGYEVWTAATSRQGWELAIEKLPDLILLDVAIPDEDGLTLCRRIKAERALANSLVALLSDHETRSEEQARSLGAEVDEYITRPISDRELLARVRAMVRIKRIQDELRDRVKELDCLYGITALLEKPGMTLDKILQGIVELMPPAWQYPEITAARLLLDDQEFVSAGFRETPWCQAGEIVVNGEFLGRLQVYYLEERPARDEGPFLREERDLIEVIAMRLSRVIERLRIQAALKESRKRLQSAHQLARIGHWDWLMETNELRWSREIFGIFGQDADRFQPSVESFESCIHPDDLERFLAEREQALTEERDVSIEHRILWPDGTVRHVHELAKIIRDDQGRTVRVMGTVQDITEHRQAQDQVRRLSEALAQSPSTVVLTDLEGNIEYVNRRFTEITGYRAEEAIGQNPRILKSGRHPAAYYEELWKTILSGERWRGEFINRKKSGELYWELASISAVTGVDGVPTHFVKVAEDITRRVQAEEALRKQTAQLESLRKINLKLTAQLDLQDLLHAITQNAVQLLEGTTGGLYLHRPDLDLLEWVVAVGPNVSPCGTMVRRGEGLSGQVWQTDKPLIVDDCQQWAGGLLLSDVHAWGSAVGVPIQYGPEADEGEFLGVLEVMAEVPREFSPEDAELLCLFASQAAVAIRNARLYELAQQEIAQREQAQEQLRRERDLVSRIMETSPIGIVILDRQGQIVYANTQVAKTARTDRESLILRSYDDPSWCIVGDDGQPLTAEQRLFAQVLSTGEPILGEQLTIEAEGGRRWCWSVSVIPLSDESGQISRLVAMVEDITARLEAEKALRDSEMRYRRLVETSPDAITLVNLEGSLLACNEQAAAIHGFESQEAMIGFNMLDLFPPDELQRIREHTQKALLEGHLRAFECVLFRKDGSCFPAELSTSVLFDEGGRPQGSVIVTRDITEREESQTALRESEERLRSTLSSLEDLVFVLDRHSRFVDYHQPTTDAELYVPPEAFLGRTVSEIMPPEVAEPFQEAFDAVATTHQVEQFDYPLILEGEQRWFSTKVSVRLDGQGEFDGVTVVSRDITERKRTEQRIQASLQEKEVLLKEIHHRVKNNLQIISSLLDMQSLSIQSPEAIDALEDSRHRVRTMAFVHERLYQSEDLASIAVREYLENLASYLVAAYERSTEGIHLNLRIEDVWLDLDTSITSGLIVNELVSNALKHAFPPSWEGEGAIDVELGVLNDGRFELRVTDNGVGFPPDLEIEEAESLGLRLVKMLTQQLQGTLELTRGDGTAFRITFPGRAQTPSEKAGHE